MSATHPAFALAEEDLALVEMARGFAEAELAPHAVRWDEEKHFPVETLRRAGELGMGGLSIGEGHGGSGPARCRGLRTR